MRKLISKIKTSSENVRVRQYSFTVLFEPVDGLFQVHAKRKARRTTLSTRASSKQGYQVTVPLLPGLVTHGRTLAEARAMARDAILCHLEGMLKAGERIPDERSAYKETVRVALSA